MSEYRRYYRQQDWYSFTVVKYNLEKILIQPDNLIRRRQSFRRAVKEGLYPADWGSREPSNIGGMN